MKERENKYPYRRELSRWYFGWAIVSLSILIAAVVLSLSLLNFSALVIILSIWFSLQALFYVFFVRDILPLLRGIQKIEAALKITPSKSKEQTLMNTIQTIETTMASYSERNYNLQLLQKQAELNVLQSQINPHFLYNTLDTIRGQALEEGSELTSDMIEALSTLLRYTISQRGDMVTLRQELKSIDNYIKIQQFRFDNRFTYTKHIEEAEEDILSQSIPKLTLQPIVENAVFHGIETLLSGGKIDVEVYSTQSRLIINVSDNGIGMDEEQLDELRKKLVNDTVYTQAETGKRGSGIAITNVNSRIKLAFGAKYGITAYSTKGAGTQFTITLPLLGEPL